MKIEKMRAEFEAWFRKEIGNAGLSSGAGRGIAEYLCAAKWRAWQASRAALVIELPDANNICCVDLQRQYSNKCRAAIEAAGVTVK